MQRYDQQLLEIRPADQYTLHECSRVFWRVMQQTSLATGRPGKKILPIVETLVGSFVSTWNQPNYQRAVRELYRYARENRAPDETFSTRASAHKHSSPEWSRRANPDMNLHVRPETSSKRDYICCRFGLLAFWFDGETLIMKTLRVDHLS